MSALRAFALMALLGCAQGAPLDGVDLGASTLESAADVWGLPLPEGWEDAEIDAPEAEVTAACAELGGGKYEGCTVFATKKVWIATELSPELRSIVLLHEVGHVLANRPDHVTDGCGKTHAASENLMCAHAALTQPTPADYDYVSGAGFVPVCSGSLPDSDGMCATLVSHGGVWCQRFEACK